MIFFYFDVIAASSPCIEHSRAEPKELQVIQLGCPNDIILATLGAMESILYNPEYSIIENPRTSRLKKSMASVWTTLG